MARGVSAYSIIVAYLKYRTLYMCAIGLLLPNGPEKTSVMIQRVKHATWRSVLLVTCIHVGSRLNPSESSDYSSAYSHGLR